MSQEKTLLDTQHQQHKCSHESWLVKKVADFRTISGQLGALHNVYGLSRRHLQLHKAGVSKQAGYVGLAGKSMCMASQPTWG